MACQLTQPTHGPYRRTHRASSSAPVANRRAESRVGRCLLVSCAPRCDRRFRSDGGGRQGGLSGNSEPRSRPAPDRCRCSRTPPDAETLRQFRRAVDKLDLPVSIEAFGPAHVYLFMGWVQGRGVSAGTQHRRQREVKAFFSWCRRMDYVEENPFMRVPMVQREQKVIQPFTKDDITTLLAACNPQTYVGSRMRAMILFLRIPVCVQASLSLLGFATWCLTRAVCA